MKEVERDANRFAAWVCLVFGLVVGVGALLGRFEPLFMLAWRFITFYLVLAVGSVVTLSMGAYRQEKEVEALSRKEHGFEGQGAAEE